MGAESLLEEPSCIGRFRILRQIGKGGMGVVYEAFDPDLNERVALKTLKRLSGNAVLRFKTESRALSDLQHPNLVRMSEMFENGGQYFFTMELIEGSAFLDYVRVPTQGVSEPAAGPSLEDDAPTLPHDGQARSPAARASRRVYDEGRLRSALAQLASGLYALHQANKVHRDIKPSNVLVTHDGTVKILDFGLITDAANVRLWPDDHLVGTVSYMAPEQAATKPVGPAADWYSVGVVLYQALTGTLPVRGTTNDVLVLKQAIEPVPPREVCEVPDDLNDLCVDLLRIDPAARPEGAEILRRLAVEAPESHSRPSGTHFVGRHKELTALGEAFARMRQGHRVAVLMHGESGVGKSAIAQHFSDALRRESLGTVVLPGRCYERESVPYKAVDGVIDSLSRYLTTLPAATAAARLPEHAGLVGEVFPVMRRVEAVARSPRPPLDKLDPVVLRTRLFSAVRELFRRLARSAPLVVVVDDLQWADADSFALLAEILRAPDAPPLLFVATVRAASKEERGFQRVSGLAQRLGGDVRTIHVSTLPADDARSLALQLIEGSSVDVQPQATAIAEAAHGHPLFIDELARQRRTKKNFSGPLRLDEALHERVSALDPAVRQVLAIVALGGTPLDQEIVGDAAGLDFGAFSRVITQLRAQNLVRTGGTARTDPVEPYHDRVREAVTDRLDPDGRRRLHRKLATALEDVASRGPGRVELEALAIHFAGAGDTDRAADYAERAADQAARAFAFDRAARLYQRALTLRPIEGDAGTSLHVRLGDALANAGRGADAAKAFSTALTWARPEQVTNLRRRVAEELLRAGLIDEGVEQLGIVLSSVDMDLPKTPARTLAAFLFRRAQLRIRGLGFTERAKDEIPAEVLERVDICWSAGVALGQVDTVCGAYFQARGLLLALRAGEPYRVARAYAVEACFHATPGAEGKERTEELLREAHSWSQKVGHPFVQAWTLLATAISAYCLGEFRRSFDAAARAKEQLEGCTGVAWERETADQYGILSSFYLGRMQAQGEIVDRLRREADERGDLFASTYVRSGLAIMTWLARDDADRARSEVASTVLRWSNRGYFLAHFWCLIANAQIDLYVGEPQRAYERIHAEWPALDASLLLRSVQIVRVESIHARARAALAMAASGLHPESDRLFREAQKDAGRLEGEGVGYAPPLGHLVRAAIAAQRGDLPGALRLVAQAQAGFEALDMLLYAVAASWISGRLRGDGHAVQQAEAWMKQEAIRAPARFARMLAPGFPDPSDRTAAPAPQGEA